MKPFVSLAGAPHACQPRRRIDLDRPLPDHLAGNRAARPAARQARQDPLQHPTRGEVVLTRSASPDGLEADDPVLYEFLAFLARDIASHPERLQAVDAGLVDRLQSLVGGIEVDLDAALSADEA